MKTLTLFNREFVFLKGCKYAIVFDTPGRNSYTTHKDEWSVISAIGWRNSIKKGTMSPYKIIDSDGNEYRVRGNELERIGGS